MQVLSDKSRGFTIPELIISITVSTIMLGVIIFGLGSYYEGNVASTKRTTQQTDTRSVLRTIENDLVNSDGFLTDLAVTAAPLGSNNLTTAWSYKGNDLALPDNRVLIGQSYATDKARTDDSRLLVFVSPPAGCGDLSTATPATNALIYFVGRPTASSTLNLYRRTIVNTAGGIMCSTPYQKQTCAPTLVLANPTVCKASDALLLADVQNFTVDYYASSNDSEPIADQYTTALAANIAAAKSVKLTVTTNRLIDGKSTAESASIRISRSY
jgi:type II secretory pathway pseudopilin PulG